MTTLAHNLKPNQFIYHHGDVFHIVKVNHSGAGSGRSCHITVDNFSNNHRTEFNLAHDTHVRVLPSSRTHYDILSVDADGFLTLVTKKGNPREDFRVSDANANALEYIRERVTDDSSLGCWLTTVVVEPLHRADKEISITRLTRLEGFDLSHQYDHHHSHHHIHTHH